jgi:polyisoprenoid-binding protein YceI
MQRSLLLVTGIALFALLALTGCSNPAEDKPEAKVEEPADLAPPSDGDTYVLSDESSITWVGSKVTGSHDGGFNTFSGEIVLVDGDPAASSVYVLIDATSIWSDHEKLTGHLKSADFFDVENFPTAAFTSTAIAPTGDGYEVTGNLELHGVNKSVTFPATIAVEEGRITAQAEFFIKRYDFGIVYPGKPDDLIRDEVVIKFDLVAVPTGYGS